MMMLRMARNMAGFWTLVKKSARLSRVFTYGTVI